jgi:lipopolysaccharide biosynthesis glycosyltransferase
MKRKILIYACDSGFFHYAKSSFATFCDYHLTEEWRVIFADVGLTSEQRAELAQIGEVIVYEPYQLKQQAGVVYSAAHARIKMLSDFADEETVLLYLDSDTLIFDNLDTLVSDFLTSKKPIAIGLEDMEEFWQSPVSTAWLNGVIPEEFKNQDAWRHAPMPNAGVILAHGIEARRIGEIGLTLFDQYKTKLWLPEQAVLDTLLYDRAIPFMRLLPRFNCLAWEKHIGHIGEGKKYADTLPHFRGERVAIRHFAGHDENLRTSKTLLDETLLYLDVDSKLQKHLAKHGVKQNRKCFTKNEIGNNSGRSIAIAINVFKEPKVQIEECFRRIKCNMPAAKVAIFLDGIERHDVLALAQEYKFLPIIGSHFGTNVTWNIWWLRMLYFFQHTEANVCFKFDPDTMVDAAPSSIPTDHYFGDVPEGVPYVQGGVSGLSGYTVRLILNQKLLEPAVAEAKPWLTRIDNNFADDKALGFMLKHVGIYPVHWKECKSVWRSPVDNCPVQYAIVHPRYYGDKS